MRYFHNKKENKIFNKLETDPNNIHQLKSVLFRSDPNNIGHTECFRIFLTDYLFVVGISSYPSPAELEIKSTFLLQGSDGQLLDLLLKQMADGFGGQINHGGTSSFL